MISLSTKARNQLHKIPGVNMVGIGDHKIIVGVESFVTYDIGLVPDFVDKVLVETIETGEIRALRPADPGDSNIENFEGFACLQPYRTGIYRPAPGGVSIGHYLITAGTLGCLTPNGYILSNNHVLANSNLAEIGDPIYQPGPYDGGNSSHHIGNLLRYEPIVFVNDDDDSDCPFAKGYAALGNLFAWGLGRKSRFRAVVPKDVEYNLVDAALAQPLSPDLVIPEILEIGTYTWDTVDLIVGMSVKKSGRTTGLTETNIVAINASVTVGGYQGNKVAIFLDQIVFDNPGSTKLAGGDSGSALLTEDNNVLGLCFAGSDTIGIANWMPHVRQQLGF